MALYRPPSALQLSTLRSLETVETSSSDVTQPPIASAADRAIALFQIRTVIRFVPFVMSGTTVSNRRASAYMLDIARERGMARRVRYTTDAVELDRRYSWYRRHAPADRPAGGSGPPDDR